MTKLTVDLEKARTKHEASSRQDRRPGFGRQVASTVRQTEDMADRKEEA